MFGKISIMILKYTLKSLFKKNCKFINFKINAIHIQNIENTVQKNNNFNSISFSLGNTNNIV